MSQAGKIGAAILAGGESRRMGRNKALLRLAHEGKTVIEMVVARLAEAGFDTPILISNDLDNYAFLNIQTLPDEIPNIGPIGGILTALQYSAQERMLVVACDMPFLNPSLLLYMATLPGEYDALAPAWSDREGMRRIEPLHTIYSKSAIPVIKQRINESKLRMTALLGALNTKYITEEEIREYDPTLKSFQNINTPDEWVRLLS
ncbi:MAG: molybdenum cofactor guanylyltransferase [Chloroflexia bacterium]